MNTFYPSADQQLRADSLAEAAGFDGWAEADAVMTGQTWHANVITLDEFKNLMFWLSQRAKP